MSGPQLKLLNRVLRQIDAKELDERWGEALDHDQ